MIRRYTWKIKIFSLLQRQRENKYYTSVMKCIYCKNEITPETESIEHTFPASFGCPDDWVLYCVCEPCNNRFGGSIEKWLASDSLESIIRLQTFGSQSGKNVRSRRMRTTVPKEDIFGAFQGAILERDFTSGQLVLAAQGGFKDEKGEYEYFTDKELSYPEIQSRIKNLSHQDIKILGPRNNQEAAYKNVIEQIQKIGIDFHKYENGEIQLSHTPPGGEMIIPVSGAIDSDIQRAAAKIAFNYLAKIQGSDYVLQPRFDTVREFINGEKYHPIVTPIREPILSDDLPDKRYFVHIFIFERIGDTLRARVSLFNQGMAYEVILSTGMDPKSGEIISGHICNPHNKEINPLGHISLISRTS